jgi:hypothetical protein
MDFYGAFNGVQGVYTAVVRLQDGKPAGAAALSRSDGWLGGDEGIFVAPKRGRKASPEA